jgi:hypothetical protein
MFNPLLTVMVTMLAYFIFGENLYVGRYEDATLLLPKFTFLSTIDLPVFFDMSAA